MKAAFCVLLLSAILGGQPPDEWPSYGRDPGGTRYSPLAQIHRENVTRLGVAWTFHTGDMYDPKGKRTGGRASALETTPLFVDGTLYLSTPFGRVIALDPVKGTQRWAFDPKVDIAAGYGDFTNRGVATWVDAKTKRRRIYIATIDARLIALNAESGKVIDDFGSGGQIDLRKGLRNPPQEHSEYEMTSPPAVLRDLVIVGSAVADNQRVDMPSGEVRAFDTRTGRLRWTFDPMPGQHTGAANAWSIMVVDPERDLVFADGKRQPRLLWRRTAGQ